MTPIKSFAEHLDGTGLRQCFDFWLSCRIDARPPHKRAIDATRMPRPIVPNLFLYELTADDRFRCRLAGSAIGQAFGRDPTGRFLDEMVNAAHVPARTALFRATLEKEVPVVYGGRLAEGDKFWKPFRRLLLPVVDDLGIARFIFGMVIFPALLDRDPRDRNDSGIADDFQVWATPVELAARPAIGP